MDALVLQLVCALSQAGHVLRCHCLLLLPACLLACWLACLLACSLLLLLLLLSLLLLLLLLLTLLLLLSVTRQFPRTLLLLLSDVACCAVRLP